MGSSKALAVCMAVGLGFPLAGETAEPPKGGMADMARREADDQAFRSAQEAAAEAREKDDWEGAAAAFEGYVGEFPSSVDKNGAALTDPTEHAGPRYMFLDNRYIKKGFKRGRMFKTTTVSPSDQPWSRIIVVDIWQVNYCRSRQRLGMVESGPLADVPPL